MADENISLATVITEFTDDMYCWIIDPAGLPTQTRRFFFPKIIQEQRMTYGVDTGALNAAALVLKSPITSYVEGLVLYFKGGFTNTGAMTMAVDALGPVAIVNRDGSPLSAGDIPLDSLNTIQYDGNKFQLMVSAGGGGNFWNITGPTTLTGNITIDNDGNNAEYTGTGSITWGDLINPSNIVGPTLMRAYTEKFEVQTGASLSDTTNTRFTIDHSDGIDIEGGQGMSMLFHNGLSTMDFTKRSSTINGEMGQITLEASGDISGSAKIIIGHSGDSNSDDQEIQLELNDGSRFTMTTNVDTLNQYHTFRDGKTGVNQTGLEYSAEYGPNFRQFSLIHKGYGDSHIGGQDVDSLIITPGVGQDGFVISWNDTNDEYELVASGGGGTWVSSLTPTNVNTIQNFVTTDLTALSTADFDGINWNITDFTGSGAVNFLNFNKDGTEKFKVDVDGNTTITGDLIISTIGKGFFLGDGDTGFKESSDDNLMFVVSGDDKFELTTTNFKGVTTGTASMASFPSTSNLAYAFTGDPDTGLLRNTTNDFSVINLKIETMNFDASNNVNIPNGTLTVSSDTDATTILGRIRIHSAITDIAYFSHFDMTTSTQFAIRQNAVGLTMVNGVGFLLLAINGSTKWKLDGVGNLIADAAGVNLNLTDTSEIQFDGVSHIEGDGSGNVTIPNGDLDVTGQVFAVGSSQTTPAFGNSTGVSGLYFSGLSPVMTVNDVATISWGSTNIAPVTAAIDLGEEVNPFRDLYLSGGLQLDTTQTIKTVHLQLTQAQIQALNTTPIEIIAAQGAGKYIQLISSSAFLDHNGTNYAAASLLRLRVGSVNLATTPSFIGSGGDTSKSLTAVTVDGDITHNTAMVIQADVDATGNGGTIDVYIQYVIIDTN